MWVRQEGSVKTFPSKGQLKRIKATPFFNASQDISDVEAAGLFAFGLLENCNDDQKSIRHS